MGKIEELMASGEIKPEDLIEAEDLIKRAKFVKEGLAACKKTISFPLGKHRVRCYEENGEYPIFGEYDRDGNFDLYFKSKDCYGHSFIGGCNLLSFEETFRAFEDINVSRHLESFLEQQIKKADAMESASAEN